MSKAHWTETADRVHSGDLRILGEDENGDLFVPAKGRPEWWDRKLDLRKPTHWRYYLRSRRQRRIVFLEPM